MNNLQGADYALATYGTLAPGKPNHHILDGMTGTWVTGWIRGILKNAGWGAEGGFPGIVLDPNGNEVEVQLFLSKDLPAHWARLDEFEGAEYRRIAVHIRTEEGDVEANIYALAD
ncbi:MAG: gamma-glutamylcyclotransferase family protein [Pseudomonadota bacterium]